jgi:hypothetical protein
VVARLARLLLRFLGWVLTPLVVLAAAGIGATVLSMVAPRFSVRTGVVLTALGGTVGATAGFLGWMRLLARSRELRDVLHVTAEGVPTDDMIEPPPETDGPTAEDRP